MKKEKSLIFPCSKWLMVTFLALGLTVFSNFSAIGQQSSPLGDAISAMTQTRDTFAPGTAKYDFAQDAIDYLVTVDAALLANPNYENDFQDQFGTDVFLAAPLRRAHPTILANYTDAELAAFQSSVDSGANIGTANPQKIQWILDANAY